MQKLVGERWSVGEMKKCELKLLELMGFAPKSLTAYDFACAFLYHFECESNVCFDQTSFEESLDLIEIFLDEACAGNFLLILHRL